MKKIISFWLPPVLWMSLIFFLSSFHKLQASPVGWQDFVIRKLAHLGEYAILCFLYYRGLTNTTKISLVKSLLLAFFMAVLYALSDEYHQTFINGRTGRSFDIGVDSFGAFFGLFFSWKIIPFLPEKIKKILLEVTL